jgi:uncharacterized protein (TIGR00369 family)
MRKILNPYSKLEGFECFGCSKKNDVGFQLDFFEDGEYVTAKWNPKSYLQGYNNVLHGGIQTTLLDEIASWVVYVKAETAGVTADLNIRFLKPVFIRDNEITIRAKIIEQKRRIVTIQGELFNKENVLCAEAKINYMVYDKEFAKKKLHYPGIAAFFEE